MKTLNELGKEINNAIEEQILEKIILLSDKLNKTARIALEDKSIRLHLLEDIFLITGKLSDDVISLI